LRFLDSEHGLWMVPPGGIWYFLRSTYDWYVCIIRPCACVCANRCIHAHAPIVFSIFPGLSEDRRHKGQGTQKHTVSIKFTGTIWHVGGGLSPPRGSSSGGGAEAARWTFGLSAFFTSCVPGGGVRRGLSGEAQHTHELAPRSAQNLGAAADIPFTCWSTSLR
jgi:hypothetical protein